MPKGHSALVSPCEPSLFPFLYPPTFCVICCALTYLTTIHSQWDHNSPVFLCQSSQPLRPNIPLAVQSAHSRSLAHSTRALILECNHAMPQGHLISTILVDIRSNASNVLLFVNTQASRMPRQRNSHWLARAVPNRHKCGRRHHLTIGRLQLLSPLQGACRSAARGRS